MNTENNTPMVQDYQGQLTQESIKNRFMIVLVLSILVSSALASLYNVNKATTDMAYLAILTPVFFILSYAIFEGCKNKLHGFFLKIISMEILAGILSFVFPLTFVAFFKSVAGLGFLMKAVLFIAIWGVPLVAIVTFLSVLISGLMTIGKRA